eukprot:90627_1
MYLFNKYIARGSELCVNLPWQARSTLIRFFKTEMNQCFNIISSLNDGRINKLLTENEKNIILADKVYFKNLLIKTYLYHIFDISFKCIWALIRDDTFVRFQMTNEYNKIVPKPKKKKSRPSPKPSPVGTPRSRHSPNLSPNLTPKDSPNNSPHISSHRSSHRSSHTHPSFQLSNVQTTPKLDEIEEINLDAMIMVGEEYTTYNN